MGEPYINYDKEPLEIWEEPFLTVYDPWQGQELGMFRSREDAETFLKVVYENWAAKKR